MTYDESIELLRRLKKHITPDEYLATLEVTIALVFSDDSFYTPEKCIEFLTEKIQKYENKTNVS